MDCLEAQKIVSAALDGEQVSAAALTEAKVHCRECEECGLFVSTLVALRRSPLPEAPEGLADRVMKRIGEVTVTAPAKTANVSPSVTAVPPVSEILGSPDATPPAGPADLRSLLTHPRHRRSLIAWSSAAAAVFLIAGVAAVMGARDLLLSEPTRTMTVTGVTAPQESTLGVQDAGTPSTALDTGAAKRADALNSAANVVGGLIEVDGVVYRSTGSAQNTDLSTLDDTGDTLSSLDTQDTPKRYKVKVAKDGSRAYLEIDGGIIGFDRVSRTFDDITYALQSGPIASFDRGVTLPDDVAEPTSPDGSPTFEPDDDQEGVYVLTGRSSRDGIALPPGADRSAGAGWTWWEPVSR